ncbi:hypothetical protein BGX28_005441 [Mortierella sp. GBA30]|nr:hypothetical protein BGX28_005441 [Mortierella sp. GBA30]
MHSLPDSFPSKPRGAPLSLRKPTPRKFASNPPTVESTKSFTFTSRSPPKQTNGNGMVASGVIVLDSESSEEHSDVEDNKPRPARPSPSVIAIGIPLDLAVTQVGGVQSSLLLSPSRNRASSVVSAQGGSGVNLTSPSGPSNAAGIRFTQESISSSQGSVDQPDDDNRMPDIDDHEYNYVVDDNAFYSQEDIHRTNTYRTQWSLSPEISSPFLSDLVAATSRASSISSAESSSASTRLGKDVDLSYSVDSTLSSTMLTNETFARTMETDFSLSRYDPVQDNDETLECVVCGKLLAHLDPARVMYHVNTCIDEQQAIQQTTDSIDLESRITTPVRSSQGEFAGAQVDYLTRVKRCPICKLDWPLKGKQTKTGSTAPKKARQKVEHMKRCAKSHNRTVQSLLYQVRLLKEKYERSLTLGTPMEGPSQEMYYHDEDDREGDGICENGDLENDDGSEKTTSAAASTAEDVEGATAAIVRKSKSVTTTRKQVASLADTADGDFAADAIITTVHAPSSSSRKKLIKLQRMHEDQHDDGLQLALAISMSMQSVENAGTPSGSRPGSPSGLGAGSTTWSMVPLPKTAFSKGGKRRKQTERERNETTVLPITEVQHLIQANVHALLFPESDEDLGGTHSMDEDHGNEHGNGKRICQMKTPPWRPSRFVGMSKADREINLSQSSEPDSVAGSKSLWNLSHLKDTHDMDVVDLHATDERRPIDDDSDQKQVQNMQENQQPANAEKSTETETEVTATFDREQYVSRFMKRFFRQDQEKTMLSSPGTDASTNVQSLKPCSEDMSSVLHGSGSRRSDNKFSSPLWSSSSIRRISFKDHKQKNEEAFSSALKNEIIGHLEAMEQHIQQAKQTAFQKIIESIKRHPIAAGLSVSDSADPEMEVSDSEAEAVDENTQDLDGYRQPSSPLLRFSKAADLTRNVSPTAKDLYSSQPFVDLSPARHYADPNEHTITQDGLMGDNDEASSGGNAYDYVDMDMDIYHEDVHTYDDGDQAGIMIYSPPAAPTADITPYRSPVVVLDSMDAIVSNSQDKRYKSQDTPSSMTSLGFSSPNVLPPSVDFVKLMQRASGAVSDSELTFVEDTASRSIEIMPTMSSPASFSNTFMGTQQQQQADHDDSTELNWDNITTPRRRSRSAHQIDRHGIGSGANSAEDDDSVFSRIPPRPQSASRIRASVRTGMENPLPSQSEWRLDQEQQQQQRPNRSALYGLPLRPIPPKLPTATTTVAISSTHDRNDDDETAFFEDNPYPPSQRATIMPSQPRSGNTIGTASANLVDAGTQECATPTRTNLNRARNPILDFLGGASSSQTVGTPSGQPSKTPSKRKSAAVVRAEAMAAEAAKAVANIKAQTRMPNYENMSMARLRVAAMTFGLKPAKKTLLVEQLTAIWKSLNPNPSPSQQQSDDNARPEENNVNEDRLGLSPSGIAAGEDDNLYDAGDDLMEYEGLGSGRRLWRSRSGSVQESRDFGAGSQVLDADLEHSPVVSDDEDDNEDDYDDDDEDTSSSQIGLDVELAPSLQGSATTTPTLERQLYNFLNTTPHLRRQFLTYKPLDLEQVWEECQTSGIQCTRQQLRRFLDQQGIICFVPAHSTLSSWRKTRAKKRKRVGK